MARTRIASCPAGEGATGSTTVVEAVLWGRIGHSPA
jgi:hypothetical protein